MRAKSEAWVLLAVLAALAIPGPAHGGPAEEDPCLQLDPEAGQLAEAIASLRVAVGGQARPIARIQLRGLGFLDEERLWRLVGPRPEGEISSEQAALILARLAGTELFARVTPTFNVVGETAVLEVDLVEHPVVKRAAIDGLTEARGGDLLEAVLERAPGREEEEGEEQGERGRPVGRCPPPTPPREWVAHVASGQVVPGIVQGGLREALERGLDHLSDQGYLLARLEGTLSADSALTLHVDEGRLEALELKGVDASVEDEVRRIIGVRAGDVFRVDEVEQGVERVHRKLPFLEPVEAEDAKRAPARVVEERLPQGEIRYRTEEDGGRSRRGGWIEVRGRSIRWRFDDGSSGSVRLPFDVPFRTGPRYLTIRGRRVTVTFKSVITQVDTVGFELIRHTPVTGLAPGVNVNVGLLDPLNRAHVTLDGGLWLNFARPTERLDYLVGARVQVPWLRVAEIGVHRYALTDTTDAWRVTPLDSYLSSVLFNRPEREYFRRDGVAAFVTVHLGGHFMAGAEYRLDDHRSMESAATPQSLFNRNEAAFPNPPIDEGRMASLAGRVEWSSDPVALRQVGGTFRSLERSLVRESGYEEDLASGWRTVNTVELAGGALGGDFAFVRVVSDTAYHLPAGGGGLRLRLRLAGGVGVPAQKQEGLGGWNALRGYGFKEFRGDQSALGMAEYHWGLLSAFVDVGSVRSGGTWIPARVGLGTALNLGDHFQLAAAWRTDDQARLAPEVKAVIGRTF